MWTLCTRALDYNIMLYHEIYNISKRDMAASPHTLVYKVAYDLSMVIVCYNDILIWNYICV